MESPIERRYGSPLFFRNSANPIQVPRHEKLDEVDENNLSTTYRGSLGAFTPLSPIGLASRTRKSSISFDPRAKLDDGGEFRMEQGPPKDRPSPGVGRVADEGFSFKKVPVKAAGVAIPSSGLGWNEAGYDRPTSQRYRQEDDVSPIDRLSSLTSASTLSPPNEELKTPPQPGVFDGLTRPQAGAVSLPECGAMSRNRSERSFRRRRPRRTSTNYSMQSAESAVSAASLYLSSWGTPATPVQQEGEEIGDYVIGRQIGYGGFSVIKEAVTIKDGIESKVAVKVVQKRNETEDADSDQVQAAFEHEIDVWRCVKHRFILPLIEVYHTSMATYCFMEYMRGGTLLDLVRSNREGLPAAQVQKYAYQMASALRYLHEDVRVIHRDFKLENCLLKPIPGSDGEFDVQVCDFGMSQYILGSVEEENANVPYDSKNGGGRCGNNDSLSVTFTGSLQYASPELASSSNPPITPAIDVWALGVSIYTITTGILPFQCSFYPQLQAMIVDGTWDIGYFKRSKGYLDDPVLGLDSLEVTAGCMTKDLKERWSIRQVLESDWLRTLALDGQDI